MEASRCFNVAYTQTEGGEVSEEVMDEDELEFFKQEASHQGISIIKEEVIVNLKESQKSLRNQLGNAMNPHQGGRKRVLCLCSAGLLRSPTTAAVLAAEYGYNTRAAGCEPEYALIPVSQALLMWADEIIVMDASQRRYIWDMIDYTEAQTGMPMEVKDRVLIMDIPDEYGYMDDFLVTAIKTKYKEHLDDTDSAKSV